MKIIPFNQIDPSLWNRFVDESPEAWLYHRTEWMQLEERRGLQNESFMICSDGGEPLGIFCVYLSKRGSWWHLWERYYHTGQGRSGPATAKSLEPKQRGDVIRFALDYLEKRARVCKANRLEVRLPSLAPAYLPPLRSESNPLWEYGFSAFPMYGLSGMGRLQAAITPDTIIELKSGNEETLFAAFDTRGRNAVRKAERSGVTCNHSDGLSGLEAFYTSYKSSFSRSGTAMSSLNFFNQLYQNLAPQGWIKTFIALYEGRPIASVLLLYYKDAVTYYAGGTDYSAQQLRPNNLILWETLKWAHREGLRWYEMGPHFPYLPKNNKMAQIGYFKRQFGGREFSLFEGVLFYRWPIYLGGVFIEEILQQISFYYRRLIPNREVESHD